MDKTEAISRGPRHGNWQGWGRLLGEQAPTLVLLALCLFTTLITDRFLSSTNITNVLLQASVMAVVAMGMTFVIVGGGFDLSVGAVVALSGCVAASVMLEFGISAGVVAGIVAAVVVGALNGFLVTKLQLNSFIATLGTMVLVRGVVLVMTGGRPIVGDTGLPELFLSYGRERLLGVSLIVWTPILLLIVLAWLLQKTAYGRRLYATGGNREAAYLAGINVDRVRASSFVWCSGLSGVAGVMLASRLQSGQPTAGEFYELTAIAAVVLGGASLYGGEGKLYKTLIGVLIMVVLANSLNLMNVDSYWQRVAIGLVIVAAAAIDQIRRRRS
ncbi:MAG TPA: ABC transporter permease [Bradyrhizobium sp.]|nr:ABC transporter permease [Bradyrhizobium sp.]